MGRAMSERENREAGSGSSSKCPDCGRALSEDEVRCKDNADCHIPTNEVWRQMEAAKASYEKWPGWMKRNAERGRRIFGRDEE